MEQSSQNLTKETALHGEIDFVDRSALCRYVREYRYFCMDKSKWEIYFHNSLGIKVVHAGPVNAVLIGQQKQYNAPVERIIKFVAAVYGLWLLEFIGGWTSTFILAMTMSSFSNIDERKLTLVQVIRRLRKRGMNMHDQREMTPLFVLSLLVKLSEEIIAQFT